MKKIANYRSGDRAEALGVTLMQVFCAVARVPREEDFGIVDAVATLLRRDGRLLYAEDSFSVQFKSRTIDKVEYLAERFEAVLNQELGLFIAHVDLSKKDLRLYSVGAALSHPNINDVRGLVVYLHPIACRFDKEVLHVSLHHPILHWSTADLTSPDVETNAYQVMKKWLELDRWNRRYRKTGMQTQVISGTNQMPSPAASTFMWGPHRADLMLSEMVPAVQLFGRLAMTESELAAPVAQLVSWMQSRGVDPDLDGALRVAPLPNAIRESVYSILKNDDRAEAALRIEVLANEPGRYVFWECVARPDRSAREQKHTCSSLDELRAAGFDAEIDPHTRKLVTIGPTQDWLSRRDFEILGVRSGVFLLRKKETQDAQERPSGAR